MAAKAKLIRHEKPVALKHLNSETSTSARQQEDPGCSHVGADGLK